MQRTLSSAIKWTGVGLHSGAPAALTALPAAVDSGISFQRCDLPESPTIAASATAVVDAGGLCTVVGHATESHVRVSTVEHVMAAFRAAGVDNVLLSLDGPEVPILDGSSLQFMQPLVEDGAVVEQDSKRKVARVLRPVTVTDSGKSATLIPCAPDDAPVFSVSIDIDFEPRLPRGLCSLIVRPDDFMSTVAAARTFGFRSDVDALRAAGLAQGGDLTNCVVFQEDGTAMNEDGLRFPDEWVRHKALDVVGDLAMFGLPLAAHYHGVRAGHALNNALLRALEEDKDAWVVE